MHSDDNIFVQPDLDELFRGVDQELEEFAKIKEDLKLARDKAVNSMKIAGYTDEEINKALDDVEKSAADSLARDNEKEGDSYPSWDNWEAGDAYVLSSREMLGLENEFNSKDVVESVKYYWDLIRGDYEYMINECGNDKYGMGEKEDCRNSIENNYKYLNPELGAKREDELKRREIVRSGDKESEEYKQAIGKDKDARIAAIRAHYQDPNRQEKDQARVESIDEKAKKFDKIINPQRYLYQGK